MEPVKIVYLEDNIHDTELIRLCFSKTSFEGELKHFDSGPPFLAWLEDKNPDDILFVMLDMEMPQLTGLETLSKLQKKGLKKFPIVFFTSSASKKNIIKARDLQADAFITKSNDFDKFQQSINDLWRFYGELNELSRLKLPISA